MAEDGLAWPHYMGRIARADSLRFARVECPSEFRLTDDCRGYSSTNPRIQDRDDRSAPGRPATHRGCDAHTRRDGESEIRPRIEWCLGGNRTAAWAVGGAGVEGKGDHPSRRASDADTALTM